MKSRKGPIALIVVGSLLALGPLWGLLGTFIGIIRAFGTLEHSGPAISERLASDISVSLWSTAAGMIAAPIGIAVLIGGIVWLVRMDKRAKAANQQIQPIAGKPGSS